MSEDDESREASPGDVGSVGEEAAKLFDALQDWARHQSGGEAPSGAGGLGDQWRAINEHLATGGQECTVCPVCQMIAKVRGSSPEVRTHLAVAASSLLQAAAAVLDAHARPADGGRTGHSGPGSPGVTRIDLEDDPPDGQPGPG